jgi:DNA-binding response OmpR family regulator
MVARRKPRILIADHDQTFLDQLADRVLQMEMTVDFAEDALTAIELIQTERYDLIVLEVGMPIHNGLEILAIAKEVHPNVPVLMIAFSSTQDWAEQALNEGAYTYLLRPLEDIGMFDRVLAEGLRTNGASRPAPKSPNDFYLTAMKNELDESPREPSIPKASTSVISETKSSKPIFGSANPKAATPMATITKRGKAYKKHRKDRLEEVFASLPDGVIELNMQGQILACNNIARDRLVLESKSRDKPLSRFIRSIATKTITETKRIDLTGHNAQLIIKPITDSEGEKRTVIVIREMVEEVKIVQPDFTKANNKTKKIETKKLDFKNVSKQPIPEYPEEGFSFMLMVDKAIEVVKSEMDRFLANNPVEWMRGMLDKEPEEIEVDPEMLTAVNRRLSKINGSM